MADAANPSENSVEAVLEIVELDGRTFAPAQQVPIPEWPCTTIKRQQHTLTLKDNDLFLIADTLGNISGCLDDQITSSLGLFCRDTRFLSRLELQFEGQPPILLSSTAQRGFALSVLCANPYIVGDDNRASLQAETIGIQRDLVLQGGLFEELTLTNYNTQPVEFELSLSFEADFADLFEIRGKVRQQTGTKLRPVRLAEETSKPVPVFNDGFINGEGEELTLAYQGVDQLLMESRIHFYQRQPDQVKGYTAIWQVKLQPHATQTLGYRLQPFLDNHPASLVSIPATLHQAVAAETMEEQQWRDGVTCIRTDNQAFNQIIERAEQDTYLLGQTVGGGKILSAGIPWFATLFGRDSLIAAMQTLMFNPALARQTLTVLAEYQGQVQNDWREEEPGKILHELRLGEMSRAGEVPHTPYYGTVDATPLWLMLYADYYAWKGDRTLLDQLWEHALAAMAWIDRSCEKTGYVTYECKSSGGLHNQGWKDSDDCIVDAKGNLAEGAIALAEVQGYVYAAKAQLSSLASLQQRPDLSDRWRAEAKALKERFEQDFWLSDQGYFALALDGNGQPIDSITSNPGHCLGSGIISPEKSRSVAERLQAPDMFSGWGIRTLSSTSVAYNPMGYHVGSVWPHDNGMIAAGLRSLGFTEQALEIAQGIFDMTTQQPYQCPPELFCGFNRTPTGSPVRYPVACSPQAWATGTVFQLLQIMVNLVPDVPNNCLRVVQPTLPASVNYMSLKNFKVGHTLLDLEFERSQEATACRVVGKRGNLQVVIEV
ncbi:amylo-alpha-1,6-glucosidase [Leptothoe spongobia]|uniref:Amylo-alpha-1,6-glucosidase n=1 Tax=Leptothoe spongobia TAU-MAC 1115 TaxID=1967444 RepID=A0A947DII4_9CYAN|nr:amylo-alpha-1,6-glucosidase [Leptothoe spongobia]MBT9316611.1 amylo-alpha-1,6-glucosidase [Leptothoe spongobia TAU-MAC 1115]